MNRVKIIMGYILAFITTVIVTIFGVLVVLKITVADKNYIKNKLENEKYYEKVSKEILNKMEYYMTSSGLPQNILEDLFTEVEIKNDVNSLIDNMYLGKENEIEIDRISERLNNNIDKYVSDHKVKVTSESYLDSFVKHMVNIYEKEVNLYDMGNGYIKYIPKLEKVLNISLIICFIVSIILIVILKLLKVNYVGSIIVSSGLIILFIKLLFFEKIDYQNILIISNNFSNMIKNIIKEMDFYANMLSFIFIILGIMIILIKSLQKAPKNG